jgi:hypothetical protein
MSQLVKTKRQANFKDFKRFGAFKGLVEQKKRCIQPVRVSIGLFWHSCQKTPIYTRTREINYYYLQAVENRVFVYLCRNC